MIGRARDRYHWDTATTRSEQKGQSLLISQREPTTQQHQIEIKLMDAGDCLLDRFCCGNDVTARRLSKAVRSQIQRPVAGHRVARGGFFQNLEESEQIVPCLGLYSCDKCHTRGSSNEPTFTDTNLLFSRAAPSAATAFSLFRLSMTGCGGHCNVRASSCTNPHRVD